VLCTLLLLLLPFLQARALKRPRLVWTPQLHALFEEAVGKLGLEKAVPKTIMQVGFRLSS
jgi:hypothetical protein